MTIKSTNLGSTVVFNILFNPFFPKKNLEFFLIVLKKDLHMFYINSDLFILFLPVTKYVSR